MIRTCLTQDFNQSTVKGCYFWKSETPRPFLGFGRVPKTPGINSIDTSHESGKCQLPNKDNLLSKFSYGPASTPTHEPMWQCPSKVYTSIGVDSRGCYIASGGSNALVKIWDIQDLICICMQSKNASQRKSCPLHLSLLQLLQ